MNINPDPGTTPETFNSLIGGLEERVFGRLPDATWISPGHGNDSTLGAERPTEIRRRENGENVDRREHASGTIYEPGYLRRAANGHLLWRAIRHGVAPPGLERLELPSNTSYVTAVRDETVDESQTVQELTPRGSSASTPA